MPIKEKLHDIMQLFFFSCTPQLHQTWSVMEKELAEAERRRKD